MPTFRSGEVTGIISERPGLQRVRVRLDGATDESRAYSLTQLTGAVNVGDAVVCNTTAVELGLGTGGWHVVHWNLSRTEFVAPGPDHVMKLRYTSLQFDAGTSELEYPDLPTTIDGVPVFECHYGTHNAKYAIRIDKSLRGNDQSWMGDRHGNR